MDTFKESTFWKAPNGQLYEEILTVVKETGRIIAFSNPAGDAAETNFKAYRRNGPKPGITILTGAQFQTETSRAKKR